MPKAAIFCTIAALEAVSKSQDKAKSLELLAEEGKYALRAQLVFLSILWRLSPKDLIMPNKAV